jgi:hypothetical protein
VGESIGVSRTENKAAAQLEWIFAQPVLANANSFSAFAGTRIVRSNKMEQVGLFQFDGAVGFALVVNQQRKGDPGLLAEVPGIAHIAQTYSRQFGAPLLELLFVFAQLRDVLAAEDSTIVAQKDYYSRRISPKRSQADRFAVNIGQRYVCQSAAVVASHGGIFSRSCGMYVKTESRFTVLSIVLDCRNLPRHPAWFRGAANGESLVLPRRGSAARSTAR